MKSSLNSVIRDSLKTAVLYRLITYNNIML